VRPYRAGNRRMVGFGVTASAYRFSRIVTGNCTWDPRRFSAARGVRVFELHGAVDWRRETEGEKRELLRNPLRCRPLPEERFHPRPELLLFTR